MGIGNGGSAIGNRKLPYQFPITHYHCPFPITYLPVIKGEFQVPITTAASRL
jgi:hypothetical protein